MNKTYNTLIEALLPVEAESAQLAYGGALEKAMEAMPEAVCITVKTSGLDAPGSVDLECRIQQVMEEFCQMCKYSYANLTQDELDDICASCRAERALKAELAGAVLDAIKEAQQ